MKVQEIVSEEREMMSFLGKRNGRFCKIGRTNQVLRHFSIHWHRRRPHRVLVGAVLVFVTSAFCLSDATASLTVDSINPNATPAQSPTVKVFHGNKDIGWYYTPTFDYGLDGIFSEFSAAGDVTARTVTVQIQTERPVNGGSVLRQTTFNADRFGGRLGGTFSPLALEAGTTYFIDFLDIQGIGVNVGMWQNDSMGNPQPSDGATTNLGAYYRNSTGQTQFATAGAAYGFDATGTVRVAGGEPILLFTGTVPEPTAIGAVSILVAAVLRRNQRRLIARGQ